MIGNASGNINFSAVTLLILKFQTRTLKRVYGADYVGHVHRLNARAVYEHLHLYRVRKEYLFIIDIYINSKFPRTKNTQNKHVKHLCSRLYLYGIL
jgi:hypothetical protein